MEKDNGGLVWGGLITSAGAGGERVGETLQAVRPVLSLLLGLSGARLAPGIACPLSVPQG